MTWGQQLWHKIEYDEDSGKKNDDFDRESRKKLISSDKKQILPISSRTRTRNQPMGLARNCAARIGRFLLRNSRICLLSAVLAFPVFALLFWLSGLSDILFETSFNEFRWPPYVDVQREVVLELLGHPTESPPINRWDQYKPLISPNCQQNRLTRRRSLLAIVKSAPDRIERREAIRATYGAAQSEEETGGFRFRTVFVMGRPTEDGKTVDFDALKQEAHSHGDMLVGDFADHYHNNTFKFVQSIGLARNFCAGGPVPFVALLDDDYLMLPWNMAAEAVKHVPNDRLYMGWRFDSAPFRFWPEKYWVSLSEYPFNAFPPYITGGAVLMTGQTVSEFHAAIKHTALFRFDDVYAGILAYFLAIHPQHNTNFFPGHWKTTGDWWLSLVAAHGYSAQGLRDVYAEGKRKWVESGAAKKRFY